MADARFNRFVIQHHTGHGPEHWDLMLEDRGVLATWRLDRPPTPTTDEPIPALRIADHREIYLTYEGPISRNRGQVTLHETGTYTTLDRTDEVWTFRLQGERLEGVFVLQRLGGMPDQADRWELRRQRDF